MKNLKIFFYILPLVLLTIMSCKTKSDLDVVSQKLDRKWMMIGFQSYTKDELMQKEAYVDWSDSNQLMAKMGCSPMKMFAQIKANYKISLLSPGNDPEDCQDRSMLGVRFLQAIPGITSYKIEGHFLTLYNNDEEVMKFVAADWD